MTGEGCCGALQAVLSAPRAVPSGWLAATAVQQHAPLFVSQSQLPAECLQGKAVDEVSPLCARVLLYKECVSNCTNHSFCL